MIERSRLLPASVRKQGQERIPEILHLLFGLRTGESWVWGELGAQSGVLGCKLVVQGTQSGVLGRERSFSAVRPATFSSVMRPGPERRCAPAHEAVPGLAERRMAADSPVSFIVARRS